MIVLGAFAIAALLYLGDDIITRRQSRVSLEPVAPTVSRDDPKQGNSDNPGGVIIEFGEFTCSACKIQQDVLKQLINNFGDRVLLVWKDAPLDPLNVTAKDASIAAQCAGKQKKFWEMHDKLFENQSSLNRDAYVAFAKDLKLDEEKFKTCIDTKETLNIINQNMREAEDAKVTSTPTFYINDTKYEGYLDYQEIIFALSTI